MKFLPLLCFSILFRSFLCDEKSGSTISTGSVPNCGGNFSGFQYAIASPNYPDNYPADRDCVYVLEGSKSAKCSQEFHLQFLDFQLEASKACSKDYLRVDTGSIYCGNSVGIRKFAGKDRRLKLIFHSDSNTTAKGFKILVTTLPCADQDGLIKDKAEISYPVFRPGTEFDEVEQRRGDQPHDFHDQNCAHRDHGSANDRNIGSVTSYLYLPPAAVNRPFKTVASGPLPAEAVVRHFDNDLTEPPAGLNPPYNQIPSPFYPQTRNAFDNPPKGQSYHSINRWLTYGTPNSVAPEGFDPFGNGNNNNRPNCNSNYPSFNSGDNFSPVPNPGFPNGEDFDLSFVIGGDTPGYFDRYPNNNFYSPVDPTTYYGSGLSECCGSRYSSSNFMLTSPGFPALIYSSSNYECQYTIRRSSDNVCQLQMYLKFFNFGSEDQFCAYGYLEVDGNRICGCKTGANITASFDNIATKTITVKYLGYPRHKFSGFVIEVTQVACSTSYLRLRGDGINRFVPGYPKNFKRNAEYFPVAESSAALRTSQNFQLINSCKIFKFFNWVKAAKQVYLRSAQCSRASATNAVFTSPVSVIPIFLTAGNAAIISYPISSNCAAINLVDGTISSLYYPNGYPNDLSQCYRFYKAPGYCQLELAMLDFDLENSALCRKDYVSFSGQKRRYCGSALNGTRTIFDLTQAAYADLYFVTDSAGSGRGFKAGFTQIAC